MPQYIELDKLLAYPLRRNHCDKKHANPHFINGIESVFEYGEDGVVNRWIFEHKMDDEHLKNIQAIVAKFNSNGSVSVRLDTSCQTAEGRYEIFRCDGKIYPSWEATEEAIIDAIF